MYQLLYAVAFCAFFLFVLVAPRRRRAVRPLPPSPPDTDDEGGELIGPGLPDLDLPPGISLPINDWEPDYNRRREPVEA